METIKSNGFANPSKNVTDIIKRLVFDTSLKNQKHPQFQKELLTREETAAFFDVDLSTLHNWKKKGILLPVGIGGRVYYRMSDIENSLVQLK